MGLCLLVPCLPFQSPVSLPRYHPPAEALFSLQLISISRIIWGWWLSEEYAEMWSGAKSAASHCSQIVPETFCRLQNKVRWSGIVRIPRISQAAVFLHFKNKSPSRSLHDSLFLCKIELEVNWLWFLRMTVLMLCCILFTKLKADFCSGGVSCLITVR